jgi:cysteinyl-tRNA synthetase
MNLTHLGEQIDIHGGGNDLVFPHHENEIAQTESFTGKQFARYWVHNGMLQFGGEKMSKSLGNLVSIEEFLSKHDADAIRMMVLNSGYRNPLTYSDEIVEQTERALERLKSALRPGLPGVKGLSAEGKAALSAGVETAKAGFVEAMDDDFNSAGGLASLFELVRVVNQARADGASDADLEPAQAALRELAGVLGLRLRVEENKPQAAAPFIELLIEMRAEARKQKLWALSDLVRDRLLQLGVVLEDSKEGTSWRLQA